MSRRYEDFDEYCDPENPRTIKFQDILEASDRLRPYIQYTSCLAKVGIAFCSCNFTGSSFPLYETQLRINAVTMVVKVERSVVPTPTALNRRNYYSFKERGIINALLSLPLDKKKTGAVVASNGNEALAFAYYAAKLNVPAFVVVTQSVPPNVIQTCYSNGAKVFIHGNNLAESMKFARGMARDKNLAYMNGRDHPHILAGYGTIALEILEQIPSVDAIIVPVGTGGLVSAVATVVKQMKPKCFIYGVQPEASALFFNSLAEDDTGKIESTLAQSINVPMVGTNAIFNARPLLDKMLLVKENWIARSLLHYYEKEHYVVEGAAACPLAAILGNIVPELKMKCVVCIVSGGNINPLTFTRIVERALSAEGYLVKFRVSIQEGTQGTHQLHRLLGAAGYSIVDMYADKNAVNEDVFLVKVRLVCETKGMDHSLQLKRIIERAYPSQNVFKNEPFCDNRGCPCYIRKHTNYF